MPKIIFLDAATVSDLPVFARFTELGDFTAYDRSPPETVLDRCRGAEIVITNKVPFDGERIAALPDLRLICIAATGKNHIDLEAADRRGIAVRNVAGYSTDSVVQTTFASLFAVSMDLCALDNQVQLGHYSAQPDFSFWRRPFYELRGKRYGIIGLGTIGRGVARVAEAFGAEVVYYSTSGRNDDQPYPRLELDELLATSDVVSIHCGLNERTRNLLGTRELERMKSSAYLVNMGRGGIVNEADLAGALGQGKIAGAAVDVFEREPLPQHHPYLNIGGGSPLFLTPHVAWASVEARTRLVEGIVKNIGAGY